MSATILIVDDEDKFRENIQTFLSSNGYETIGAATLADARRNIQQGNADVILLDVLLPDGYGPDLLEETTKYDMRPPVIVITGNGDIDMAVKAMKDGATDFLQKPVKLDRLEEAVSRAVEIFTMRRELMLLRQANWEDSEFRSRLASPDEEDGRDCEKSGGCGCNNPYHRRKRHWQGSFGRCHPASRSQGWETIYAD